MPEAFLLAGESLIQNAVPYGSHLYALHTRNLADNLLAPFRPKTFATLESLQTLCVFLASFYHGPKRRGKEPCDSRDHPGYLRRWLQPRLWSNWARRRE